MRAPRPTKADQHDEAEGADEGASVVTTEAEAPTSTTRAPRPTKADQHDEAEGADQHDEASPLRHANRVRRLERAAPYRYRLAGIVGLIAILTDQESR